MATVVLRLPRKDKAGEGHINVLHFFSLLFSMNDGDEDENREP
jgi:hypothetical protein